MRTSWLISEDQQWYAETISKYIKDKDTNNMITLTLDFYKRLKDSIREFLQLKKTIMTAEFWMGMCREDRVLYGYIEREFVVLVTGNVDKQIELYLGTDQLDKALLLIIQQDRIEEELRASKQEAQEFNSGAVKELLMNPTHRDINIGY